MSLVTHRGLIAQLVRREISQRYRGSLLGMAWPFLQPLILLAVYTFLFSVVFKARWPHTIGNDTASFALVIFTGLITFTIFSETVSASPRLILANRSLVKQVVFPLEILPLVKVVTALTQGVSSLMVLFVYLTLVGSHPSWTVCLLPMVWLPLSLFALGLAYLLSAIGVFLRDLDQVVGVILTALFFGSAIFYPLSSVPEPARNILEWVPTAVFVEDARQVLLFGGTPFRIQSLVVAGLALATAALGYRWFMRSKRAFADVL